MARKNSVANNKDGNDHDASVGGLGKHLYTIHSARRTLTCFLQETKLEFYEHAMIARVTKQWACFPKRYRMMIIPRFKIVDVACSLCPRLLPIPLCWLIIVAASMLIAFGVRNGGCSLECHMGQCIENSRDSSSCACVVIGSLILCLLIPFVEIFPFFRRWQYIYFYVRRPASATSFFNRSGTVIHKFRLKKTLADVRSTLKTGPQVGSDAISFDEMFIAKYVYGSLAMGGVKATSQAHIISHFNNASLAAPIMPVYADKAIGELFVPSLLQDKPVPHPPPPKSKKGDPAVGRNDVHEGRSVDISSTCSTTPHSCFSTPGNNPA